MMVECLMQSLSIIIVEKDREYKATSTGGDNLSIEDDSVLADAEELLADARHLVSIFNSTRKAVIGK